MKIQIAGIKNSNSLIPLVRSRPGISINNSLSRCDFLHSPLHGLKAEFYVRCLPRKLAASALPGIHAPFSPPLPKTRERVAEDLTPTVIKEIISWEFGHVWIVSRSIPRAATVKVL